MFRFFENLIDPFPPEHPSQPPATLYAFCRHYMQGMERYLLLLAILTAVMAVSEAMLFSVLGKIVDWLSDKNTENFFQHHGLSLLGMAFFILIFIPVTQTFHSLVLHQSLMGNFPMSVRWKAHRYLLGQSYGFFQNEFSGRIATKVMQTALAVRDTVVKLLNVMLFVVVYLMTTIVLIVSSDWRLSVPLLFWLVTYISLLRFFIPRLQGISTLQADARSVMTGRIVDSYTNIMTLKLFSHHRREAEYIKEGMDEFMQTVHPQMRMVTCLDVSVWTANMLLIFATAATGIVLWVHGAITPGAIAIAISLAIRLTGMSQWIMWEVSGLFENVGTVQDGLNTIAKSQQVTDAPDAESLRITRGDIDFNKIGFSYHAISNHLNDNYSKVFDNFSLHIKAGEKVGIVGRSGAGKSTLVNLLLRFYDIQDGKILIDGQDIRAVQQESLRGHIGMVTQDTSLLHRSVRENIMFGKPGASEAQMINAAQRAQAHEFIQSLQDIKGKRGYDAHVGERGVTLSGGQRQRIAIARVLLKDAPILVLDEATSALDSEVEASIQGSLYQLMEGKTVIAIAHRLSTIAAMDRLIVMDKGQIVEQGSHKELLAQSGLYAQLWARQSGGFIGIE